MYLFRLSWLMEAPIGRFVPTWKLCTVIWSPLGELCPISILIGSLWDFSNRKEEVLDNYIKNILNIELVILSTWYDRGGESIIRSKFRLLFNFYMFMTYFLLTQSIVYIFCFLIIDKYLLNNVSCFVCLLNNKTFV